MTFHNRRLMPGRPLESIQEWGTFMKTFVSRLLKKHPDGRAVQKCTDARRAKTEERGVHRNTSSDEICSATLQTSVFQQPARWNWGAAAGKLAMGLVLAAMIGSIDAAPALGRDDHRGGGGHDRGRYEDRGRGHDRDRGHYEYYQGRRIYRPYGYGYGGPVYVPPPVIYAPPPPPGIGIFVPPIIIHR